MYFVLAFGHSYVWHNPTLQINVQENKISLVFLKLLRQSYLYFTSIQSIKLFGILHIFSFLGLNKISHQRQYLLFSNATVNKSCSHTDHKTTKFKMIKTRLSITWKQNRLKHFKWNFKNNKIKSRSFKINLFIWNMKSKPDLLNSINANNIVEFRMETTYSF